MWGSSTPVPAESWLLLAALMWGTRPPTPSQAAPLQNSSPLYQFDGQVRLRHLYTANTHTQLYLEITPQGEVRGAPDQTPYSLMEIKAVKPGVIRMQGMKTLLFLCMDPSGHLHGASSYSEACNFQEKVQRDGYNLYFSETRNIPVSLRPAEGPPGGRGHPAPRLFHFLPMVSRVPVEPVLLEYDFYGDPPLDVESSDPLSMMGRLSRVLSPSYIF
ncbi:fibroblast growth factor 21 [Caretta caretta]|uniref:fibroblast growth factor 21 n=1 Tax=Caretta caretta TaxID=8467 RepID=UPI003D3A47BA